MNIEKIGLPGKSRVRGIQKELFITEGDNLLNGKVKIGGAKNSAVALPAGIDSCRLSGYD